MKKTEVHASYEAFLEDFRKSSTAPVLVKEPSSSYPKGKK